MNIDQDPEEVGKAKTSGEDYILLFLFGVLLAGVLAVLASDYRSLTGGQISFDLPFFRPNEIQTPILPARDNDQVRRYSPQVRVDFGPRGRAVLPGFEGNPDKLLNGSITFHDAGDGRASLIGLIDPGTYPRFQEFLSNITGEPIKELYIHSPGGSVADAINMARHIRALEIKTIVPKNGYCASSCPLVFSGGLDRSVGKPVAIGVHQIFANDSAIGTLQDGIANAQVVSAKAQTLLVDMGVDPRAWIDAMATPKDRLYLFNEDEIRDYRWSTDK